MAVAICLSNSSFGGAEAIRVETVVPKLKEIYHGDLHCKDCGLL